MALRRLFFTALVSCLHAIAAAQASPRALLDSARKSKATTPEQKERYALRAYELAALQHDEQLKADATFVLAGLQYIKGNYDQTLKGYLSAEQQYRQLQDTSGIIKVYNELCVVYVHQKKFREADEVSSMAITQAAMLGDLDLLANAYNNRGLMFLDRKMNDSAEHSFRKSYFYYNKVKSGIGMSYSLDYLSGVLAERGELDKALQYLHESKTLRIKSGDKMGEAIANNNIGELMLRRQQTSSALSFFKQARILADALQFKDLVAHTYNMEADAQEQSGNWQAAYKAARTAQSLKEELLNEKSIRAFEEMQARYETEKKEQQNRLLTAQNKVKDLKLRQRNTALYITGIALLAVIGIAYLLYNRYKLQQQARMQQELLRQQQLRAQAIIDTEENERQRLARELHDGVAQALAAVRRKLQHSSTETGAVSASGTEDNGSLALLDESIREVRELSHSMMPPALRNKTLVQALDELAVRVRQSTSIEVNTQWVEAEELMLNKNQTLMLYRAVQEILSNSVKHAAAGSINIELVNHHTELTLMIYDDGAGFNKADMLKSGGLGLKNIESRIAFINGILELDTQPGRGTTYIIDIPLNNTA